MHLAEKAFGCWAAAWGGNGAQSGRARTGVVAGAGEGALCAP
jgi:hypothetical protein